MDLQPHLDIHLSALPDVLAACQDPDIDQITILLNGRWTVRKLGQLRRQQGALKETDLSALRRALSRQGQGVAAMVGWHFRQHASGQGWLIVAERMPEPTQELLSVPAQHALRQAVEQGLNGLILGPPGTRKAHLLAWLAQQYAQDQIIFVSDLPPATSLGPRVIHLYPPQDRAQARSFSRFLSQCDAVLWDRVLHPYDLQDCMSHAGATRRWVTFDAQVPEQGLVAFARQWNLQPWGELDMVVITATPPPSTPTIAALCQRQRGRWVACVEQPERYVEQVSRAFASPRGVEPAGAAASGPSASGAATPQQRLASSPLDVLRPPSSPAAPDDGHAAALRVTGLHDPRRLASSEEIFEDSEGSLTRSAELAQAPLQAQDQAQAWPAEADLAKTLDAKTLNAKTLDAKTLDDQALGDRALRAEASLREADLAQTVTSPLIERLLSTQDVDLGDLNADLNADLSADLDAPDHVPPVLHEDSAPSEPLTQEILLGDEDIASADIDPDATSEALYIPTDAPPVAEPPLADDPWITTQEYQGKRSPGITESTDIDMPGFDLALLEPAARPSPRHTLPLGSSRESISEPDPITSPSLSSPSALGPDGRLRLVDESSLFEFELPELPASSDAEEDEEDEEDAEHDPLDELQAMMRALPQSPRSSAPAPPLQPLQDELSAQTSPSIASPLNALMVDPLDEAEHDVVFSALDSIYAHEPAQPAQAAQLAWSEDEATQSRVVRRAAAPASAAPSPVTPPAAPLTPPTPPASAASAAHEPYEDSTSSMSLRMNNLSMRLKALRQQRLGSGMPEPPEDLALAEPDEPTQITAINLQEVEALARRPPTNQAQLLRKLRGEEP